MTKPTIFLLLLFGYALFGCTHTEGYKIFDNPPDSIPKIFAKGIISVEGLGEFGLAISPDYNEIFYSGGTKSQLMVMHKLINGNWSYPKVSHLRGDKSVGFEAFYTTDGQKLFFTSFTDGEQNFWYSDKENGSWSKPRLLKSPVNDTNVFWATFTNDHTMYYTNLAVGKIYKSCLVEGVYAKPEDIGLPRGMVHPSVSEDGRFIICNGRGDIYITFAKHDGSWTEPVKLGEHINSDILETCPSLSPDGKYIFFCRYNDLNGVPNIYWVSSGIIDKVEKEIMGNEAPN